MGQPIRRQTVEQGAAKPVGQVTHVVKRDLGNLLPFPGRYDVKVAPLSWRIKNFVMHRLLDLPRLYSVRFLGRVFGFAHLESKLYLRVRKADGRVIDYGLVSERLVTDTGVDFIVDAFQNIVELEILKFHGIGTGSSAEAQTETALVTELTTEYSPDNTRATGSLTEGGSTNVYRTVGTNTVDAGASLREHGIFSQAATGGGVMLDRSLFALITLSSGDSLESTYDLTVSAGG